MAAYVVAARVSDAPYLPSPSWLFSSTPFTLDSFSAPFSEPLSLIREDNVSLLNFLSNINVAKSSS